MNHVVEALVLFSNFQFPSGNLISAKFSVSVHYFYFNQIKKLILILKC